MNSPDLDFAATKAAETLIKFGIKAGPVDPLWVIKTIRRDVIMISFAELALQMHLDRDSLLQSISPENHDAMSFTKEINGDMRYFVVYNQRLPYYLVQRGLARELGHIIIGHDGSRMPEARMAEAQIFAYHFLCPRALVRAIQESGIRFSTEVLGNATGCFERCLAGMRKTPGTHVPRELNRMIRDQFSEYIENFIDFQKIMASTDESRDADFGTYMDGYED